MSIQVASCTLTELFSGQSILSTDGQEKSCIEGQLTIPEYQRPYRWHDEQVQRLLNDLTTHKKEQESLGEKRVPYYLGSIILHQEKEGKRLNIIDGQQRLTTLAIITVLQNRFTDLSLSYNSPESQQQIKHNLGWLQQNKSYQDVELDNISVTLVVTLTEDDAYRFFETQNTGGVRLSGADIIKAHHLRAVDESDKRMTNQFARRWEGLGDLTDTVDLLMRGRYWQQLFYRDYPLHRQKPEIRKHIVHELAEQTGKGEDIAFFRIKRIQRSNSEQLLQTHQGYDIRQPLNGGANAIHYLQYFQLLRQRYLLNNNSESIPEEFNDFYQNLICNLAGCSYLKQLFDVGILLYISQFGEQQLASAAKKLFRVVYSRRVENKKAVKEKSVPAFIKETPVLDWIAHSYTPEQCFILLDNYELKVDGSNLDSKKNPVKKKFILQVCSHFKMNISDDKLATEFGKRFSDLIKSCHLNSQENNRV